MLSMLSPDRQYWANVLHTSQSSYHGSVMIVNTFILADWFMFNCGLMYCPCHPDETSVKTTMLRRFVIVNKGQRSLFNCYPCVTSSMAV